MKRYIIYGWLFLAFAGCKKSFLEKIPLGQLAAEQLFEDIDGMKAALNGSYSLTAKNFMLLNAMYGDVRSDDAVISQGSGFILFEEYNFQSNADNDLGAVTKLWQNNYETLNNINQVINSAPKLRELFSNNIFTIDSLEAQALVLRAITNFCLCQYYAQPYGFTDNASHLGLPVLLKTPYPGTVVKRESVKDVYDFILNDLTVAEKTLEKVPVTSKIHVTADAVRAFKSRVYLYMGRWNDVIVESEKLIVANKYPLVSAVNYESMFISEGQNNSFAGTASEVIWQLQENNVKSGYVQHQYSNPNEFIVYPSDALLELYKDGDIRKTLYKASPYVSNRFFINKYGKEASTVIEKWPAIYKVFRMAEVYLNYAEALWHTNKFEEAAAQVKAIQSRAYSKPVAEIDLDFNTPDDLLQIILTERRKELAFEGQRTFDLLRNKLSLNRGANCVSNTCRIEYPNDLFILPVPQSELDANKAMQPNPGVNK